jgi:hypothetical protein
MASTLAAHQGIKQMMDKIRIYRPACNAFCSVARRSISERACSRPRLRSYAGAEAAAAAAGTAATSYYTKLLELTEGSDGLRPERAQATSYLRSASK